MNKDWFLKRTTRYDSAHWVDRVQKAVWDSVDHDTDPIHPECDVRKWMHEVIDELVTQVEENEGRYDGNIRSAYVVSMVFAIWASRIAHAKAYDPNRKLTHRRKALKAHRETTLAMIDAITDETHDSLYFAQEWNPPYGSNARGGNFE